MHAATAIAADTEFDRLIERIADAVQKKLVSRANAPGSPSGPGGSSQSMSAENRSERRRRVLMSGKITGGRRHASIDCSIRNMSSQGACINLDGLHALPETFQLYVQREGLVRDARLVWNTNLSAGIAFTGWEQQIADTDFTDRNSVLKFVKSMGIAGA